MPVELSSTPVELSSTGIDVETLVNIYILHETTIEFGIWWIKYIPQKIRICNYLSRP